MKAIIMYGLALTALVASPSDAQSTGTAKLTGSWSGTGTFFKSDLKDKLGPLAISAEFKADGSGSGRVGDATMKDVRVKDTRGRIEVNASLSGSIGSAPELAKDHIVLLVTSVTDSTMVAEFHLKSNSIFDMRMREGRVVLRRTR